MRRPERGHFSILKIEIDGHFHGGEPVRPWVAEIEGVDARYGLARRFLQPMNDWRNAHKAWSGNVYGRISHFMLREGHLYEVSRCRGNSSRRHVVREFMRAAAGKRQVVPPLEALAIVDGGAPAALLTMPDERDGASWVARVTGLGTPERLGWVVIDGRRSYRLTDGVYEVVEGGARRLVGSRELRLTPLSAQEALAWLA